MRVVRRLFFAPVAAALLTACAHDTPPRKRVVSAPQVKPPEPTTCPPIAAPGTPRFTPRQLVQGHHTGRISSLVLSPSGRLLASTSTDGSARVWDTESRAELAVLRGADYRCRGGALGFVDETHLLLSDEGHTETVDLSSGARVAEPGGAVRLALPEGPARTLSIRPNQGYFLGYPGAGTGTLAEPEEDGTLWGRGALGGPRALDEAPIVVVSEDGRTVMSRAPRDALWVFAVPDAPRGVAPRVVKLGFSADAVGLSRSGKVAVLAASRRGDAGPTSKARVVDVATGALTELPWRSVDEEVHGAAVSADGAWGAVTTSSRLTVWSLPKRAVAWEIARTGGRRVLFSRDGAKLFAGDSVGGLSAYASSSGHRLGELGAPLRRSFELSLLPDGTLATLSRDHVSFWSLEQGKLLGGAAVPGVSAGASKLGPSGDGVAVARIVQRGKARSLEVDRVSASGVRAPAAPPVALAPLVTPDSETSVDPEDTYSCGSTSDDGGSVAQHEEDTLLAFDPARMRAVVDAAVIDLRPGPARRPRAAKASAAPTRLVDLKAWHAELTPDGSAVLASSRPFARTCLWSTQTGESTTCGGVPSREAPGVKSRRVIDLGGRETEPHSTMSGDGGRFAVGEEHELSVYTAKTGALVSSIKLPGFVRSLAFVGAGGPDLLVGAQDGALTRVTGGAVAKTRASDGGAIRRIVTEPKGKLAVTLSEDGVARVWDTATLDLRASLVDFDDGEWAVATPAGAYAGTAEVGDRIGWVFDQPLEHFGFEQFSTTYRDEARVQRRLAGAPEAPIAVARPPSLALTSVVSDRDARGLTRSAKVTLDARSWERVDTVRAYVEGRPAAAKAVCAPTGKLTLDVPLGAGSERLTFVGFDARGYSSNAITVDTAPDPSVKGPGALPEAWVVAVGIDDYRNLPAAMRLSVAAADARGVAGAFSAMAGTTYAKVHTALLTDAAATPEAIRGALGQLGQMRESDVGIVFFAGHGFKADDTGNMVFVTQGISLRADGRGVDSASLAKNAVAWSDLAEPLAHARGRVLVLLDACHSGHLTQELVVPSDALAGSLAKDGRAGAVVFAASKGRQLSYEPASSRGLVLTDSDRALVRGEASTAHGFFTGALLESLRDRASDRNGDGTLQLSELIDEVTARVTRASGREQTPWVVRRDLFGDFGVAKVPPR